MAETLLELRKFVIPEIIIGVDARLLIGRYISHFTWIPEIYNDGGSIPNAS